MKRAEFRHVFIMIAVLVSVADYVDHVTRADDRFAQIWPQWLVFSALSTLFLIGIFLAVAALLRRTALPKIIGEALGLGVAVLAHLTVTGTLAATIASVESGLRFDQPLLPVLIAVGAYMFGAGMWAGVTKIARDRRPA